LGLGRVLHVKAHEHPVQVGMLGTHLCGLTKKLSLATAKNSSTASRAVGVQHGLFTGSTEPAKRSNSAFSVVATPRGKSGGSSGTPSAKPSAMSSTWANSWMTTL
jgi:hypothetical protein